MRAGATLFLACQGRTLHMRNAVRARRRYDDTETIARGWIMSEKERRAILLAAGCRVVPLPGKRARVPRGYSAQPKVKAPRYQHFPGKPMPATEVREAMIGAWSLRAGRPVGS